MSKTDASSMFDRDDSDCRRDHLYAQRLNNLAALCIEAGDHDKAVALLVKALYLSRANKATYLVCACNSCSLDQCIAYSEERATVSSQEPKSKKRKIDSKTSDDEIHGYTHKRPILVPPTIIGQGHILGPILALIVTFNLALANHLKLIQALDSDGNKSNEVAKIEKLTKVLKLYEIAYRWESEMYNRRHVLNNGNESSSVCNNCEEDQEQTQHKQHAEEEANQSLSHFDDGSFDNKCSSLRFDMIVCNNLSQIHRIAGNQSKQEKCLQHLLSIMMFVVDWQRERANISFDEYEEEDLQEQQHQHEEQSEVNSGNCAATPQPETVEEPQQHQRRSGKRKRSVTYMDMDGFLRNVSPFLLKDDCAEAA